MVDYWGFHIIIDDIVLPDGETHMGILGGGGPQTTFGMRLWSESVGLIASVGPDLPSEARDWLNNQGIKLHALQVDNELTPRAWQIMEEDGRRYQIWRVQDSALAAHFSHQIDWVPEQRNSPKGFHFGVTPNEVEYDFINDLKATGAVVSIETYSPAHIKLTVDELEKLVSVGDIFSLNLDEAHSILGPGDPLDLLNTIMTAGAKVALLRMGAKGSLAAVQDDPTALYLPAVPVDVVNPIGAGNAFCGGFLVGYSGGNDLGTSAAMAAVSASFMVEQTGLPDINEETHLIAQERLENELSNVESISFHKEFK